MVIASVKSTIDLWTGGTIQTGGFEHIIIKLMKDQESHDRCGMMKVFQERKKKKKKFQTTLVII